MQFEELPQPVAFFWVSGGFVFRCHRLSIRKGNRLWIYPAPVLAYQCNRLVHGPGGGHFASYNYLSPVKCDPAGTGTIVTVVSICHFTGAVHNTSHDADLDSFEVIGALADHRRRLLQVEQRSST